MSRHCNSSAAQVEGQLTLASRFIQPFAARICFCSVCWRRLVWVCGRLRAQASGELPPSVPSSCIMPHRTIVSNADIIDCRPDSFVARILPFSNATDFDRKRHARMMREAQEAHGIALDTSGICCFWIPPCVCVCVCVCACVCVVFHAMLLSRRSIDRCHDGVRPQVRK